MADPESRRLTEDRRRWFRWGPYLAERAWGTVREDYSQNGDAWSSFPHDHARSRAYRWNEDGLGGICDESQILCLSLAFWNGRDPILKERAFGLTGHEGNHAEDAKELWWFLDSTPTHSYMRWAYAYPQGEFPYDELRRENAARSRTEWEFELEDSSALDAYWDIEATYAKAEADDICLEIRATNRGQSTDTLHVLPTLWFRNTWSWNDHETKPEIRLESGTLVARHDRLGTMTLKADGSATALLCENETNAAKLYGTHDGPDHPKDGIGDHVISGAPTVSSRAGTKAAFWHRREIAPGESATIRVRLAPTPRSLGEDFDTALATRRDEANRFYDRVIPDDTPDDERQIARQAFAGLLWSKQFYHYDVAAWLDGDPTQPAPPPERRHGRNSAWIHLNNDDIISMPDTWEYPWYAAWDLAFHCIPLAHVDSEFAKQQLLLLCREWYMHPNGQLPAYEWSFGDVNPPVHAMAALKVFEIDGSRDFDFLERVFHKLLLYFTWWVNRKDAEGNNVFEGGFLGLDNIGPFDRSEGVPDGFVLEQSDGTAWMAMFALDMMKIALVLARQRSSYEDLATKFFEHFAYIVAAIHDHGLWDEDTGFYFDVLHAGDRQIPLRVRSLVGLIPLGAVHPLPADLVTGSSYFAGHFRWFVNNRPEYGSAVTGARFDSSHSHLLLAMADVDRMERLLGVMLDPTEFLSGHGIRSLSAAHRHEPFVLSYRELHAEVGYEPGESQTPLFGGNSNWRGPVWLPLNYLLIESLRAYDRYLGPDHRVEYPVGTGHSADLSQVADDIQRRLIDLFRPHRMDPRWPDRILFHEYFDGDTGRGLGASHQTGWTGLVAHFIVDG